MAYGSSISLDPLLIEEIFLPESFSNIGLFVIFIGFLCHQKEKFVKVNRTVTCQMQI